ncbi:MAG: uracil-DNA glycosylase family protein, partial [Petrimonas sp.]|nr:uracil-DNA glycosylase family protein [Petrimonas sp.]
MNELLREIRNCKVCEAFLPLGPKPVIAAHSKSRIVVIGQAPGRIVHETGVPWNDKSGDNLREWMGVDKATFYDPEKFALMPMGFCYPGRGKSGDLPPRPECAPLWHGRLLDAMKDVRLILL